MDERIVIRQFHELVDEKASTLVNRNVTYSELYKKKNVIVICSAIYLTIIDLIHILEKCEPDMKVTLVGKKEIWENVPDDLKKRFGFIEWNQPFDNRLIELVDEKYSCFDAYIFFSKAAMDLRDRNLIEIAAKMSEKYDMDIFSFTSTEELNQYTDINKYLLCMQEYEMLAKWVNGVLII